MLEQLSPAELEARMRQILSELAVTAEAAGVKLGDIIHGGEPDRSPHGPRCTLAEYHGRRWRRARSHEARCEALTAAQEALINAHHAPRRSLVAGTLEWRVAIARDPRRAEVVAQVYGVSRGHVYYCRKALAHVVANAA
jgi:hypothetical protein